jgi:hypothetical protein
VNLAIRWTIGDVSSRGFEALALSIEGAHGVFGSSATYVVCVNTVDVATARHRTGPISAQVDWHDCTHDRPKWLADYVDAGMAEGVAWKFAPIQLFRDRHTLSLDNDVILWRMPPAMQQWLDDGDSLLIAEDVRACYGTFADRCPREPRNSGIRGLPPAFDTEAVLHGMLKASGKKLRSEVDEQGLQVAMVTCEKHRVVPLRDVSICGYFRPHLLHLGECGAHFVGINTKSTPWEWNGRAGEKYIHEFWDMTKVDLIKRLRRVKLLAT